MTCRIERNSSFFCSVFCSAFVMISFLRHVSCLFTSLLLRRKTIFGTRPLSAHSQPHHHQNFSQILLFQANPNCGVKFFQMDSDYISIISFFFRFSFRMVFNAKMEIILIISIFILYVLNAISCNFLDEMEIFQTM